jgi:hypothetical protein
MTTKLSWIIALIAMFASTVTYYLQALDRSDSRTFEYQLVVGSIAHVIGVLIIPLVIVAVWASIVFIWGKKLPVNFLKVTAQFFSVFLALMLFVQLFVR